MARSIEGVGKDKQDQDMANSGAHAVLEEAIALFARARVQDAIKMLENGMRKWPKDPALSRWLGTFLSGWGDHSRAIPILRETIKQSPDDLNLLSALAFSLDQIGKYDEATKFAARALTIRDRRAMSMTPVPINPDIRPRPFDPSNPKRNVIAFSLWGEGPVYTETAIENARLAPLIYPGWSVRFYIDRSVKREVRAALHAAGADLVIMPDPSHDYEGLFWRFNVVHDPNIHRYIIRDADSLLTLREAAAVDAWLDSGKTFHIMRDSGGQTSLILAGAWGGVGGVLPDLRPYYESYFVPEANATIDQVFLGEHVWAAIRGDALIHDRVNDLFGAQPFPPEAPEGYRFIIGRKWRGEHEFGHVLGSEGADAKQAAKAIWAFAPNMLGMEEAIVAACNELEDGPDIFGVGAKGYPGLNPPTSRTAATYQRCHVTALVYEALYPLLTQSLVAERDILYADADLCLMGLFECLAKWKHPVHLLLAEHSILDMARAVFHAVHMPDVHPGLKVMGREKFINIVNFKPFQPHGRLGWALWAAVELETRAAYIARMAKGHSHMTVHRIPVKANGGEVNFPFLPSMACVPRQLRRASVYLQRPLDRANDAKLKELIVGTQIDPVGLANVFVDQGRRLG